MSLLACRTSPDELHCLSINGDITVNSSKLLCRIRNKCRATRITGENAPKSCDLLHSHC